MIIGALAALGARAKLEAVGERDNRLFLAWDARLLCVEVAGEGGALALRARRRRRCKRRGLRVAASSPSSLTCETMQIVQIDARLDLRPERRLAVEVEQVAELK